MKRIIIACASAVAILGAVSCSGKGASTTAGNSFNDSISQAFGRFQGSNYGQMLGQPGPDGKKLDKEAFLRGFKQAVLADTADMSYIYGLMEGGQMWNTFKMWHQQDVADADVKLFYATVAEYVNKDSISRDDLIAAQAQMQALFNQATARLQAKQDSIMAAERAKTMGTAEENKAKGTAYLDSLKKADPSIKTTPSGLAYKVVKQGTGANIAADATADVIYTGRLIDGTEFDSSKGNPVQFPVKGVVPGFGEGLQLMNPGSKYILYIPSDLGYGDQGNTAVPAGAMMVFEVEIPAAK